MTLKTCTLVFATLVLAATSLPAAAKYNGRQGFAQVDSQTGKEVFNDGVDDGKQCAVKKVSVWNPETQDFDTVMKKVKCNY